jgi:hypothetical protein
MVHIRSSVTAVGSTRLQVLIDTAIGPTTAARLHNGVDCFISDTFLLI